MEKAIIPTDDDSRDNPSSQEALSAFTLAASSSPLGVLDLVTTAETHHPIHWPVWKKWFITIVYCALQTAIALLSSSYISAETPLQAKFGGSTQVVALGQSLFIVGTAVGPSFLGPLSDIGGRKWVYVASIFVYGLCQIGCSLALNLPMVIIFMFFSGVAGSTALCNVAGTITDLFGNADNAGQPMGLFVVSANTGPSIGSVIGEWIADNPHMGLNWVFWINVILAGAFSAGMACVPETLPRVVIARAAQVTQKHDTQEEQEAQLGSSAAEKMIAQSKVDIFKEIRFITTMTFRIMFTEPIVTFLGLFNGFIYGLLFLYLDGIFDVFVVNNDLSIIGADLTYLNVVVGVVIMFVIFVPVQTVFYTRDRRNNGGVARPEARFLVSLVTVWGFPISLFWFAFTSKGNVSYWSPIIAGGLLNVVDPILWLSMLNYLTDSYPNVAASAVAAFLIPSFLVAAGCVHIGIVMFDNLSTQWSFAVLAFVSLLVVAWVYLLYFWGPQLRKRSKLAKNPS